MTQAARRDPGAPVYVTDTKDSKKKVVRADMVAEDPDRYQLSRSVPTVLVRDKGKQGKAANERVINRSDFDPDTMTDLGAIEDAKRREQQDKTDAEIAKQDAADRLAQAKQDLADAEAAVKATTGQEAK